MGAPGGRGGRRVTFSSWAQGEATGRLGCRESCRCEQRVKDQAESAHKEAEWQGTCDHNSHKAAPPSRALWAPGPRQEPAGRQPRSRRRCPTEQAAALLKDIWRTYRRRGDTIRRGSRCTRSTRPWCRVLRAESRGECRGPCRDTRASLGGVSRRARARRGLGFTTLQCWPVSAVPPAPTTAGHRPQRTPPRLPCTVHTQNQGPAASR